MRKKDSRYVPVTSRYDTTAVYLYKYKSNVQQQYPVDPAGTAFLPQKSLLTPPKQQQQQQQYVVRSKHIYKVIRSRYIQHCYYCCVCHELYSSSIVPSTIPVPASADCCLCVCTRYDIMYSVLYDDVPQICARHEYGDLYTFNILFVQVYCCFVFIRYFGRNLSTTHDRNAERSNQPLTQPMAAAMRASSRGRSACRAYCCTAAVPAPGWCAESITQKLPRVHSTEELLITTD